MKAVKGNKEYTIDESQQKVYQDGGYDIVEDGAVIAYGRGKTVPYDDYAEAVRAIADLTDRVAGLQAELKAERALKEPAQADQVEKKAAKKAGE